MPKIETWVNLPVAVRQHLIDRMRDRSISITDLNQLRLWSQPNVPDDDWYKDFGKFKIWGKAVSQDILASRAGRQVLLNLISHRSTLATPMRGQVPAGSSISAAIIEKRVSVGPWGHAGYPINVEPCVYWAKDTNSSEPAAPPAEL